MIVEHGSPLPVPAEAAFAWHARSGAFERLVPPWEHVRLTGSHPGLAEGSTVELEVEAGPFTRRWVARHSRIDPGRGFVDEQVTGPFARWRHEHRFEPATTTTSVLVDRVELELPGGPLGELAAPFVRRRVRRMLRYRHRVTAGDLALHLRHGGPRLRVAVTGASGLVGRVLRSVLTTGGHTVVPLVRRAAGPGEISWDPAAGRLDPDDLAGVDAVIHLAGESIAGRRWSDRQRRRIRDSRVHGTSLIANAIARAPDPPQVLVSASAVGIYGDRGDDVLDEASGPGDGFLAAVGTAWEEATAAAQARGVRTVHARNGLVLTPAGGVLGKVRLPFSLGIGGPLGDGRHWMSWIGIDDAVGALVHALGTPTVSGPMNVVAPEPVRNAEFTQVLGRVMRRPAVIPVPGFALRLAVGELADEGLLASTRVRPGVLESSGYVFRHRTLEEALRHVLGRGAP